MNKDRREKGSGGKKKKVGKGRGEGGLRINRREVGTGYMEWRMQRKTKQVSKSKDGGRTACKGPKERSCKEGSNRRREKRRYEGVKR